ncbi:response regulator [Parafrankia discariae]|uniref:response regulator n=1 Tax=Parafrankia discariae TaxID=365528 RepID=UPI00037A4342|nr:response regulator transcription factor [Parafrankia discariae]
MIRVLLADDQALIRAGFRVLVEAAADITVVAEAADGAEAVRLARETRPDVILMDIRMPGVDGLSATRELTGDPTLNEVKVLVLTTFELDEHVFEALRVGASGFLGKGVEPDELVAAIRVVARGDALLSPQATRHLIEQYLRQPATPAPAVTAGLDLLTKRENEIVRLIAYGLTNDEIAEQLYLSPLTVKTHANRAMTKVAARDRAQLVVIAYQTGLVEAPSRK